MKFLISNFKFLNKKRGFTVLEAIIAILVLSLAIAGTTTAVRTGLIGSSLAKDQVKAFYLAQEAIEVLRNMKDANALKNYNGTQTSWLSGITDAGKCAPGNTCTVDAFNYTISNTGCSGWDTCPFLRQNPTTYLYGYNGAWNLTSFRREVMIESLNAVEISVTVQVSWTHGVTTRSFKTKTTLMRWFSII